MKKLCLMLILLLCLGLLGCSTSSSTSNGINDELEEKIAALEEENNRLKEQLAELSGTSDNAESNNEDTVPNEQNNDVTMEIKEGDTIKTDRMEIKIKKIEFSYNVLPDNTDGFYTHHPAETGHVYIHIDTDIKNIQKQILNCDDIMVVEANYNDEFTYSSFAVPEDASTGFTYANITSIDPLQTLGVRFLIDCPQEVEETDNPLFLIFNVDKQKYKYIIR